MEEREEEKEVEMKGGREGGREIKCEWGEKEEEKRIGRREEINRRNM